jgi:hypothetical protein
MIACDVTLSVCNIYGMSTPARHIFQAYPVWTYTESNITSNHIRTCFQHIKLFPNANANHRRFFDLSHFPSNYSQTFDRSCNKVSFS